MNHITYHEVNNKGKIKDDKFNSLKECRNFCEKGKTILFESPYYDSNTGNMLRLTSLVKKENKYTLFVYCPIKNNNEKKWFWHTIEKKDSDVDFILIKLCKEYLLNKDKP